MIIVKIMVKIQKGQKNSSKIHIPLAQGLEVADLGGEGAVGAIVPPLL